jgi:hypothetical protein
MTDAAKLAEFSMRLCSMNAMWTSECADNIGQIIRDMSRDETLDVADQMRRTADTLSAFAEGMQIAMGICSSCLPDDWSFAMQRSSQVRAIAVQLRAMAERMARRAA